MQLLLAMALAVSTLSGADATGVWSGTLNVAAAGGENGTLPAHLVLKQEGETLTGTAGPNEGEQRPIQNGKVAEGRLRFELPMDDAVMRFVLTQEGDQLKGDVTRDRDGQLQRATLAVKRVK